MKTQRYLLLVFCLAVLVTLGHATPSFADKRVALVIGNGSYQYSPALANPPNDAKEVAQALKAIGFDVTLKVDVEKRRMDQVIAEFAREGNGGRRALLVRRPRHAVRRQELPDACRCGAAGCGQPSIRDDRP